MKGLCSFCPQHSKYLCPTCQRWYCSVECFQSTRHNACAQQFYKRCVVDELANNPQDVSDHTRHKIISMLADEGSSETTDTSRHANTKVQHNASSTSTTTTSAAAAAAADADNAHNDSLDSDDELSLCERMTGVDIDDSDEVWKRLTDEERQEFVQQADSGVLSSLVWQPWWTRALAASRRARRPKRSLVSELSERSTAEKKTDPDDSPADKYVPVLLSPPPAALQTMTSQSSPEGQTLVFNALIGVLYAYSCLQLLYDGCWSQRAETVAAALHRLCPFLTATGRGRWRPPSTPTAALQLVDTAVAGTSWQLTDEQQLVEARRAVGQLLSVRAAGGVRVWVLAALSDVWRVLAAAAAVQAEVQARAVRVPERATHALPFHSNSRAPPLRRRVLMLMRRKTEFLSAWSRDCAAVVEQKLSAEQKIVLPTRRL